MTKLRLLGLAMLVLVLVSPNLMAQRRGGAIRGGVRGAMVGGLIGGSSGAAVGVSAGLQAESTIAAISNMLINKNIFLLVFMFFLLCGSKKLFLNS